MAKEKRYKIYPMSLILYIASLLFLLVYIITGVEIQILKAFIVAGIGLMSEYYYILHLEIKKLREELKEVKNGGQHSKAKKQ